MPNLLDELTYFVRPCVATANQGLHLSWGESPCVGLDEDRDSVQQPVAALTWLEKRLREHPGTILVVSHDRVFLERTATALLEVDGDRRTVARHGGGYAGYLRRRAAERLGWEQEYRAWCEEVKRQEEPAATVSARLTAGPRPDAERGQRHQRNVEKQISSRVRNAGERLNLLHAEAVPPPPQPLRFTGRAATATSAKSAVLVETEGVVVEGRLEVDSLTLKSGTRLLITGANGAGKSTLLRVLAGELRRDRGSVRRHGTRIGWLPQELAESRPGQTLLTAFAASMPGPAADHRKALLSLGLFRPEDLDTPAARLSIGQRRRLALARLLRMPADVLLLDEPTNHLSPGLVEDLEVALAEYPGALVIVSHDRMLNERFTGDRVDMHAGRFTDPRKDPRSFGRGCWSDPMPPASGHTSGSAVSVDKQGDSTRSPAEGDEVDVLAGTLVPDWP